MSFFHTDMSTSCLSPASAYIPASTQRSETLMTRNVGQLSPYSVATSPLAVRALCQATIKLTWSETWSRSQSIPHDAPAECRRTLISGDREKVCAELLSSPPPRAASPR